MYILKYFGYIHTDWETIIIITILVGFIPFDLSGLINNDIKLNNKIIELEDNLEKLKEKDIKRKDEIRNLEKEIDYLEDKIRYK